MANLKQTIRELSVEKLLELAKVVYDTIHRGQEPIEDTWNMFALVELERRKFWLEYVPAKGDSPSLLFGHKRS